MRKYIFATFTAIVLSYSNIAQAGYDPNIGVWLSRDPIGEKGGLNLYGYVFNNPVNAIDPLGLDVRLNFADGSSKTVNSAGGLRSAVNSAASGSIDSVFIDGHATDTTQTFSYDNKDFGELDRIESDLDGNIRMKSGDGTINDNFADLLKGKLTDNARINLLGCNAGDGEKSLAELLSKAVPGAQVLASPYKTLYFKNGIDRSFMSAKTKIWQNGKVIPSVRY